MTPQLHAEIRNKSEIISNRHGAGMIISITKAPNPALGIENLQYNLPRYYKEIDLKLY
jgi:hypothetical protein